MGQRIINLLPVWEEKSDLTNCFDARKIHAEDGFSVTQGQSELTKNKLAELRVFPGLQRLLSRW
jgi:hypothetical protein